MTLGPLPDYPWDSVAPLRERAAAHPDGLVDLSVGSPVDPVPDVARRALAEAADAHAYPTTQGTPDARTAVVEWFERRRGVRGLDPADVLLSVGSKEFVALTPYFLGLGEGDVIVQPEVAYPTYHMGAAFAGAEIVSADDPDAWPERTRLVWLNSPGNPDGRVLDREALARAVARAREVGAILVSDECYAELGWGRWAAERIPSVLDPEVSGGDLTGLIACSSLSKRSNLAGYRAAYAAGDRTLVNRLVTARKHAGLIMPGPIQHVLAATLRDDEHADAQRERYRARRERLLPAVERFGLRIERSEAGLYLWGTRDEDAWDTMRALAERGVLAGPGPFYGDAGERFVRLSLTACDEAIDRAVARLSTA